MEFSIEALPTVSLCSEGGACSDETFPDNLPHRATDPGICRVVDALIHAFRIPESGIGMIALAAATRRDLASLKSIAPKVFVPDWASRICEIVSPLSKSRGTDESRDLIALRDLPRLPIRDYLAPLGQGLPLSKVRILQAIRALLTLVILSTKGELTADLARELARWLNGKLPAGLDSATLTPYSLAQLVSAKNLRPETIKLINQIAFAIQNELRNPFGEPVHEPLVIAKRNVSDGHAKDGKEGPEAIQAVERDILSDRLAEQASATRRRFSGLVTSGELHHFELELAFPQILAFCNGDNDDEAFAAETAFHIGILPSQYHRFPLSFPGNRGYAICPEGNAIRLDLTKVIGGSAEDEAADARAVIIPFPDEFARRIQKRLSKFPAAKSYDQLFSVPMDELQRSTRSMLRSISISSHRVTLTRLARSRGRYSLYHCRDEAYAALIGVDFLLGTTANFNYLSIRAERLKSILRVCYRGLGYAGDLATENVRDVRSPYLPNEHQVAALLTQLATKSAAAIASLPNHCRIQQLFATHSSIAKDIYVLTKFLTGSRPVEIETVTRTQVNLVQGLAAITDKRISPYHERRCIALPAYVVEWLGTYADWLRLVACRLSRTDREQAALINSAATSSSQDWHPLFFSLNSEGASVPIGSQVLATTLASYGIASNAGRHWVDAVARDANIDSAAIMGHAGRGNPGQELFGRWSGATPSIALRPVSQVVDRWLDRLNLPHIPTITPRTDKRLTVPHNARPYVPKLLETNTGWMESASPRGPSEEPCPLSRSTAAQAASFPRIFSLWRENTPPPGWAGVALSLVLEDGVICEAELLGVLAQIATGTVFESPDRVFVDSNTRSHGIRRTDLSIVTRQLARKVSANDAVPIALTDLDAPVKNWSASHVPPLSTKDIVAIAEAYVVMNFPAAVSAWARGETFARTSRPATVARGIHGRMEPPTFNLQRRVHRSIALRSTAEAIQLAKSKREGGASHETAINVLRDALECIRADGCDTVHTRMEIGYLLELSKTLSNLNTLLRYESGARSFIRLAADAIAESGADDIEWKQLIAVALEGRMDGSAPDITAINSALRWMGLDINVFRRTAAPPSSLSYAEIVSAREVTIAINLFEGQRRRLGDDYHLASIAILLLAELPLRWDSVAHLRLCDLTLTVPCPHLAITEEAGANLKSRNAVRVLRLTNQNLVRDLELLADVRRARFPDDPYVPLFGDANDPRSNETANRVHRLITDALWRATGSPVICVHDLRHHAITRRIHSFLSPGAHLTLDTLALRQGLIECAIDAGQSWPQVSMENYGHGMEQLRTQHYRGLLTELDPPSDVFIAAVTGVPAATIRKRRSRDPGYIPDLAEGFAWDDFGQGTTIVPLASLVDDSRDHIALTAEDGDHTTNTRRAVYVGLRLLGDREEVARAVSGLSFEHVQNLELAVATAPQRLGSALLARHDINRQVFLDDVLNTELAVAMSAIQPERSSIARIEKSLQRAGEEWTFANPQDALDLTAWIRIWAANDISTEFLLRPAERSVVDSDILGRARSAGFARARTLPPRHFRRGVRAILRFFPKSATATKTTRTRASPQKAFLVGACALAILYYPLRGENDVQAIQVK